MKRKIGRIALLAVVGLYLASYLLQHASAQSAMPYNDISSSFAKSEIIDLYEKNIITGTSASTFSPTQSITRAEFVTVLDRMLRLHPVSSPVSPFTDVSKSAWYYGWIQAAVQLGLAEGTSASTFAPAKSVTRQEAAALLARALKQPEAVTSVSKGFKDSSLIAAWAKAPIGTMQKLGLMKGDNTGKFRPNDSITRQETAVMIDRVLQNNSWSAELKSKAQDTVQLGWQYDQTTSEYEQSVLQSNVNTLSPRWYFMGNSGAITDNTDSSLITWAKKNKKKVWAMVGNRSNQEVTHQVLSDSTSRNQVINNLTAIVKRYGLDGLNIDFENVAPEDRAVMTTFITDLSEKLHAIDAVLAVNVSPDLEWDWTEAFDYAELGKHADYIVMMGYDEHWSGGTVAGSVASLPFVESAINKLLKAVSNEKVILAMPYYNLDWTLNESGGVSSADFITLIEQNQLINTYSSKLVWDSSGGQYTTSYTKNRVKHSIWIEDGRSLTAKYKLAANNHIAGTAFWYVGSESPDIWTSLSNAELFFGYSF
ncbi:hypothetical protein Back11_57500 [Paenibacillus baekrokdamisoli]|uniref:Uncharacterized protein n=1 Tax=Paenibacillus baekrokdamisoli TaxID=1712516 RepID=A0A3G9J7T0_9BACL|nr:S-layer homology domain-containing protein [Paenibacillus baekrokdamisoli]MBB3072846.1 spore germination protein YaaH [Paenibacillus baekrokdamisoli]BBH24405.1 hypothetical protein Back11_57500 [Paenibacillus baekrokdamisoli]